jgi:hypothetical protein
MVVNIPGQATPRANVKLAARSCFDVPKDIPSEHRGASELEDEHMMAAQRSHDRLIVAARRLFADGKMNGPVAENLMHRIDALQQHGARAGRVASRVIRQLATVSGHLEV